LDSAIRAGFYRNDSTFSDIPRPERTHEWERVMEIEENGSRSNFKAQKHTQGLGRMDHSEISLRQRLQDRTYPPKLSYGDTPISASRTHPACHGPEQKMIMIFDCPVSRSQIIIHNPVISPNNVHALSCCQSEVKVKIKLQSGRS
jgi:hypothetical protein